MRDVHPHPSVRQAEEAFLRRAWWLFPLVGAVASLAVGGPFWDWVAARPTSLRWANLLGFRAGLAAAAFLVVPAAWWVGLRLKRAGLWVCLGVLVLVAGAEVALRSSRVQAALWLAAQQRLDPGQHFMREVCYVRQEEATGRGAAAPAVVLVGSSQVLHGVDDHRLRELLWPQPVIRRAVFGLTPLKALAMRTYMPFRAGDVCVLYLSELDFTNQDEFPFAWFRPYASWRTLPAVVDCLPRAVRIRHWRHLADYALAATTEWWRARDFLSQIAFHFTGRARLPAETSRTDKAAVLAAWEQCALHFSDSEWQAFRRFAAEAAARRVGLLVFEGDVVHALQTAERMQARETVRGRVAEFVAARDGRYVSLAEQDLGLTDEDWLDIIHLNPSGRDKLTRRIARELGAP